MIALPTTCRSITAVFPSIQQQQHAPRRFQPPSPRPLFVRGFVRATTDNKEQAQRDEPRPPPVDNQPAVREEEQERDLVIPILVGIAFAAYTAIAIIGLFY